MRKKRDRFNSAMEWIGNTSKQIGFVAAVLMDALFNDSAPAAMNIYVNRRVCLLTYSCKAMGWRIRRAILRKTRRFFFFF